MFLVNGQNSFDGFNGAGHFLRLTFTNNEFVLHGSVIADREWTKQAYGAASILTTKNIKAAARFRSHADSKAEKIFSKLMLKAIALPTGGVLQPEGMKLYAFQENYGVPHILESNRSYLAHEPGLGKSAQSICAVNSKPGRTLIIVPSFLRITWAREITKWAIGFPTITIVPESSKSFDCDWSADFIIVSDAMISKEWVTHGLVGQSFRFTFIDEGHRFKTPDASRTVALFGGRTDKINSQGLIYNSEHVCILSGTPLLNRPIELWPVLSAMAPELIDFMPYEDFGFKYGGAIQDDRGRWRFVGSANEAELKSRIMGRFMQRIRKKDVLKDLPDKVREVIVIDKDKRKSDVVALDRELLKKLKRTDYEKPEALGDFATVRHENGLSKVDFVVEYVTNILSSDVTEQLLLFAHHRDVVEALARRLKPWGPAFIYGGIPNDERTEIQDRFQSGKIRIIIGNIDSMNLGLTLTAGTRAVFAEYSWTGALNEQAEDRLHRIGQKNSVLCQYLVLPNSIDETILAAVMVKDEHIAKVMG